MGQVLVVDPVASVREAIGLVLGLDGYDVAEVGSGEAAIIQAAASRPHVVLVDPLLPDMTLDRFCARLRALDPSIPVVIMRMHTARRASATGPCCPGASLLDKPFTADELLSAVARLATLAR